MNIDYRNRVSLPIRSLADGSIFCVVTIYGWRMSDVPIGTSPSRPMAKAMERLGLDPDRYAPFINNDEVTEDYHGNGRPIPRRSQGARGRND